MELINSMNGTQNDRYLMQDPYVQGANDPMAAPPGTMSAAAGQDAMAANTAAQRNRNAAAAAQNGMSAQSSAAAGTAASTQGLSGANHLNMRHGLSSDVIGSPISVEEAFEGSMRGMLSREIGAYIAATFLMGNGELVRWEGRLYEVGNNYIVIYQQEVGRYVRGDSNSLRFVEFSESGNRFALMSRPCTNNPTAW